MGLEVTVLDELSAPSLFPVEPGWIGVAEVGAALDRLHYLGAARRGIAWRDHFGIIVLCSPSSRRIPGHWLELSRWCLFGEPNAGSQQWATVSRAVAQRFPTCSTVVSYSDPSVGHTGALYRACGWLWAPTWHRLRPPPPGTARGRAVRRTSRSRIVGSFRCAATNAARRS